MSTTSSQGLVEGSSGIGELIANTLAVRNVTVVVLDVKPIVTENCTSSQTPNNRINELISFCFYFTDNIVYYKCDVSKWEEVEAVSKTIVEEVSLNDAIKHLLARN